MSKELEVKAANERRLGLLIMDNKTGAALVQAATHLRNAADLWSQAGWANQRAEALIDLGRCLRRCENDHDAAAAFAEAAQLLDSVSTEGALACEAHLAAGQALRNCEQLDAAEKHLRSGLSLAKRTNDLMRVLRVAGAKADLADVLIDQGRNEEGIELTREALKTFEDYRKGQERARCHEQLASAYAAMEDYDTAAQEFEASASVNLELGRRFEASETLSRFADFQTKRGAHAEAVALLERCFSIHQQDHNRSLMAVAQRLKGMVLSAQGNLAEGRETLEHSLDLATAVEDLEGQARARYLLAGLDRKEGKLAMALDQLDASLELAVACGHLRVQERIIASMARLYREQGDHDRALDAMHRWVELLKELGEHQEQLRVLGSMASINEERGSVDQAEKYLHEVLAACTGPHHEAERLSAHRSLAIIISNRDEFSEAAEHFRTALLGYRDLWTGDRTEEQHRIMATLHYQYGNCLLRTDEVEDAMDQFDACLCSDACDDHLRARALVGMGNARTALGQERSALDFFEQAAGLCEEQGDIRATSIIRKATQDLPAQAVEIDESK